MDAPDLLSSSNIYLFNAFTMLARFMISDVLGLSIAVVKHTGRARYRPRRISLFVAATRRIEAREPALPLASLVAAAACDCDDFAFG